MTRQNMLRVLGSLLRHGSLRKFPYDAVQNPLSVIDNLEMVLHSLKLMAHLDYFIEALKNRMQTYLKSRTMLCAECGALS